MECQRSDSKKLLKVFDGTKRKHKRKKRDGPDDCHSLATDDSIYQGSKHNGRRTCSAKASLQNTSTGPADVTGNPNKNGGDSSPAMSQVDIHRVKHSPRHHRRAAREGISLALKAGLVSTPRSTSPSRDEDGGLESVPQDQDSFIYQFLEEAIRKDKKKQRHLRRQEEQKASREREASVAQEHRHHHRRHREDVAPTRERESHTRPKEQTTGPVIDQSVLLETFAKICAEINRKPSRYKENTVSRSISHKSLQCEVPLKQDCCSPVRHCQREIPSPTRIRSHHNFQSLMRVKDNCTLNEHRNIADKCVCCYPQSRNYNCESKVDMMKSRARLVDDRFYGYAPNVTPPGSCVDAGYGVHRAEHREYKEYDRREPPRERYIDDRRRYCDQKASRSFEIQRDYGEEVRVTSRSDPHKSKRCEVERNRRYGDRNRGLYYDEKPVDVRERVYGLSSKEKSRRHLEQFDRNSLVSRDIDDRYSEKERDSGLSGADGETSTASGRSNYMRVVKQEIAEQREAMDKMMKLWKELMRCFKAMSQNQDSDKTVQETENVRESAAAQLRLWRECMRRYETVARDVGDTDARLMEEITKQRSEMAEMANMWQECLQRYRDMSNDFNSLKKQLVKPESPQRLQPLHCVEGEGLLPPASYRPHPNYPPGPCPMSAAAMCGVPEDPTRLPAAPPAWWWADAPTRRRSSPDSRASKERRHRRKERDDTRYKEKPTKPNAARSEHRHRKR